MCRNFDILCRKLIFQNKSFKGYVRRKRELSLNLSELNTFVFRCVYPEGLHLALVDLLFVGDWRWKRKQFRSMSIGISLHYIRTIIRSCVDTLKHMHQIFFSPGIWICNWIVFALFLLSFIMAHFLMAVLFLQGVIQKKIMFLVKI